MNTGKGREKGKVMYNKIGNQNKLHGQCQMDILKNTTCNQVLNSGIYYSMVEHLIKQLFLGTQRRTSKQPNAEHHLEKKLNDRYIIKVDKHSNKDITFYVCQKLYCSE